MITTVKEFAQIERDVRVAALCKCTYLDLQRLLQCFKLKCSLHVHSLERL